MMFDTDILIWIQRGNIKASKLVDNTNDRFISIQTYMELIQGDKSKNQQKDIKNFLTDFNFNILPLTENIGHRASIYLEEYSSSCGMRAGDAIIAATAVENNLKLISGNIKHFQPIKELHFKTFKA